MDQNQHLFERAQQVIPGGVNSPVRAFRAVGGSPKFMVRGVGPRVWDANGQEYIDYVCSWGPLLHGHAHPLIVKAVCEAAQLGMSFGAPTEGETQLAELIAHLMPHLEQIRLTSSGTEATMSAIRLARGFTGRTKIVKFDGCYHGHGDALLVKAGSGALTFGQPDSGGVPAELARHTLVLPYNDEQALRQLFAQCGEQIAAVIIEPIAGNMNMVLPEPGYLSLLRQVTQEYGTLLIFDEVMTGFRVALGGAQSLYAIQPDLTTLGKVVGGGMPLAVLGGRREVMQYLAPVGPVYQAGTLSGNPVAVQAGLVNLRLAQEPMVYEKLQEYAGQMIQGLQDIARETGIAFTGCWVGGMFGIHFQENLPKNLEQVKQANLAHFNEFFQGMLQGGVYLAPSAYEAGFVSTVHGANELDQTLTVARRVMQSLGSK